MFPDIRLASAGDISGIMDIERRSFPCPWDMDALLSSIVFPSFRTWTSRVEGRITGYISAQLDSNRLHIVNLAVHDEFRREGLATDLLKTAEEWGQRLGALISNLEVRESAQPALTLYRKSGYRKTRFIENYYPDGEDGLEFQKPLHPYSELSIIAERIVSRCDTIPPVGVVLGSGLSWLADEFGIDIEISYGELLGNSDTEVAGHPGKLIFSSCGRFVFLLGRRHHYQGYTGDEISTLPGVLADLGVSVWILTSSSGAVDTELRPGDAVLFRDHVNFTGCVPQSMGCRIRKSAYSLKLRKAAEEAADRTGTELREGIFACTSGPAYETSAEIEYLQRNGISTVSMSIVPEALLLSSRGFDVAAVSLVTNAASPGVVLTHEEVLASQKEVRKKQGAFLSSFMQEAALIELQ